MVMYLCHLAFVGNGSQHKSSSILAWLVLQRLKRGRRHCEWLKPRTV